MNYRKSIIRGENNDDRNYYKAKFTHSTKVHTRKQLQTVYSKFSNSYIHGVERPWLSDTADIDAFTDAANNKKAQL